MARDYYFRTGRKDVLTPVVEAVDGFYDSAEAERVDKLTVRRWLRKTDASVVQLSSDGAQVFTFVNWGTWFIWLRRATCRTSS